MPADHRAHKEWLGGIIKKVDDESEKPLHPVLEEFKELIESNTRIYMRLISMFKEVPRNKRYGHDPTGNPEIRDHSHFLHVINHLLTTAPSWTDKAHRVDSSVCPSMPSSTGRWVHQWIRGLPRSRYQCDDQKDLERVGKFLRSPESANVLNDTSHGWFGQTGRQDLTTVAKVGSLAETNLQFHDMFECDPSAPNHGFKSWGGFFTHTLKDGIRPVEDLEDGKVIANACESRPFRIAHHVHARDKFWIKVNPTLCSTCWAMMPLRRSLLAALSTRPSLGVGNPQVEQKNIDMAGPVTSQGYITSTATRALVEK
ncbi:Phosphatidylserine decarboxylase family protein [Penicillium expansum]|nr:Phosphatidylserine decarboxylase family protein [Penicillium expansum]